MISNLIQNIGKCRDLIAEGNKKQIICKIGLFTKVCDDVKVQMYKFIKNIKHPLDFNYADLQELSDEIADFLKDYPQKFRFSRNFKALTKNETIDNKVIEEFINSNVNNMYIDARLREAQKILSYFGIILWVYEQSAENQDLMHQLADTIKGLL